MNLLWMAMDRNLKTRGNRLKMCTVFNDNSGVLREKTKLVDLFDDKLHSMLIDMVATMNSERGIGLAAPQVGKSLSVCVIDTSSCIRSGDGCVVDSKKIENIGSLMPLCLVNPTITKTSEKTCFAVEGCLSIPKFSAYVCRPESITVEYFDGDGQKHELSCNGMLARCAQHEIDHLNGILYVDRASELDKSKFEKLIRKPKN